MDAIYKKPHFYATLDASKKVEAYAFSADKSQFSITPVSENSISHRKNGFSQSPEPRALPPTQQCPLVLQSIGFLGSFQSFSFLGR